MATASSSKTRLPRHAFVFETLQREIVTGQWSHGDRLPSEAELVRRFGLSRITVGRAMRDLQAAGYIERRAGSGSYVQRASSSDQLVFGLLIPSLGETEIFEPICQGMMASPRAREHALLWGNSESAENTSPEMQAWSLCQHYIERKVAGVFFAPLEHVPESVEMNGRIARALSAAGIPLVLLDRPITVYPEPGQHDLVGIDNRHAGDAITSHLINSGCRRIVFVGLPAAAATVGAREAGYREALFRAGLAYDAAMAVRIDPADEAAVLRLLEDQQPDGIVCANDRTAGRLMHTLRRLGQRVPEDVRLVGVDDVEYASLLPVPLTTLRQPTRRLGALALTVMLERLADRQQPPRDVRLHCELVVRESCGSAARESA